MKIYDVELRRPPTPEYPNFWTDKSLFMSVHYKLNPFYVCLLLVNLLWKILIEAQRSARGLNSTCLAVKLEKMSDWEDDTTCDSFQMSAGAAFVPDYGKKKGE